MPHCRLSIFILQIDLESMLETMSNANAHRDVFQARLPLFRDRNKEKFLHVRRTCGHVRLTCPPIFSHVQKIMHRSTQNYKFRKTGTILNYSKWLFFREFCLGD